MTRNFPLLLLMLVCALLSGCRKNEFVVTFALPANVDKAYSFIYYASDPEKGFIMEGAVSVQKGQGKMQGITHLPTLVYLMTSRSQAPVFAYAERGDKIEVTGESGDPLSWKISGNKLTEALSAWRLANKKVLEGWGSDVNAGKVNAAVAKQVNAAPDDPVSALILAAYYDRRVDPKGFAGLVRKLKDKGADPRWLQLVGRADLLEPVAKEEHFPKEIVLRTVANGCDTVVFKGRPVLLFFSDASRGDYQEDVKLLRELSKELKDSAKRVIVNVGIDPDSVTFVGNVRRDSLSKAVLAWAPLGLSGPEARDLDVSRIPWVVVTDSLGKPIYRGADMQKGAEAMRNAYRR